MKRIARRKILKADLRLLKFFDHLIFSRFVRFGKVGILVFTLLFSVFPSMSKDGSTYPDNFSDRPNAGFERSVNMPYANLVCETQFINPFVEIPAYGGGVSIFGNTYPQQYNCVPTDITVNSPWFRINHITPGGPFQTYFFIYGTADPNLMGSNRRVGFITPRGTTFITQRGDCVRIASNLPTNERISITVQGATGSFTIQQSPNCPAVSLVVYGDFLTATLNGSVVTYNVNPIPPGTTQSRIGVVMYGTVIIFLEQSNSNLFPVTGKTKFQFRTRSDVMGDRG